MLLIICYLLAGFWLFSIELEYIVVQTSTVKPFVKPDREEISIVIRVVLAGGQLIIREGIKKILEQDKEIKVVGCAENGKTAYKLCEQLLPDVVIMDIVMPVCDGFEGTRLIKTKRSVIKVIILATLAAFIDDKKIMRTLNCGADGYILKDIKPEDLILTIKSAYAGLSIMDKDTYKLIMKRFNTYTDTSIVENAGLKVDLSSRELSIIRLIADGNCNSEIADNICLTEGSVRNAISVILRKLNLKDRTQLAVFAVKNDIV